MQMMHKAMPKPQQQQRQAEQKREKEKQAESSRVEHLCDTLNTLAQLEEKAQRLREALEPKAVEREGAEVMRRDLEEQQPIEALRRDAAKQEQQAELEYRALEEDFEAYCKEKADYNPPQPLAAEAYRLFESYRASVMEHDRSLCAEHSKALIRYQQKLTTALRPLKEHLDAVRRQLRWALAGSLLRAPLRFLHDLPLLRQARVSIDLADVSAETSSKIEKSARFLALKWASGVGQEQQGLFSVYHDRGKAQTVIQVGIGSLGSIFLTLPEILDPMEVARRVLEAMQGVLGEALRDTDPIAVVNGALPELNMKELMPEAVVVRSRGEDTEQMRERIGELYARPPLSPGNTRIISAIPTSEQEMAGVELSAADWDIWRPVARDWERTAAGHGHALAASAPAEEFLDALRTEQNVIVLVAHAEEKCIYFPQPAPNGSRIGPDDIRALREEIERNRPAVYLFCCEAAKYSDGVTSISQALLECGAAAVVAPQRIVQADLSQQLFDSFLKHGSREVPLLGLRDAERETRNRDLETWLG